MDQLLAHLAMWPQDGRFQSHTYQKIDGGANNILYKVSGEDGDLAFEVADMMTHPQFMIVPPERWDWVVALFAELCGEETAVTRIRTYYPLMLVWWVARLSRALYEIPRGQDERLAPRDPDWQQQGEQKLAAYIQRAFSVMSLRDRSAYGPTEH